MTFEDPTLALLRRIQALERRLLRLEGLEVPRASAGWVFPWDAEWPGSPGKPLTSANFTGDSFSTVGKTLLEMSTEFDTPANTRAVLLYAAIRDSASSTTDCKLTLAPNDGDGEGFIVTPMTVNDRRNRDCILVPCTADGNIYYQVDASGVNTADIWIAVYGFLR